MPARFRRLRELSPLGWRAVVLLGLAGVGYATGQVLAPSVLVVGVAAHAVVGKLTARGSPDRRG